MKLGMYMYSLAGLPGPTVERFTVYAGTPEMEPTEAVYEIFVHIFHITLPIP